MTHPCGIFAPRIKKSSSIYQKNLLFNFKINTTFAYIKLKPTSRLVGYIFLHNKKAFTTLWF